MFEWFKSKPKSEEEKVEQINPYAPGDKVQLIWNLYNESSPFAMRMSKEDEENERAMNKDPKIKPTWDICQFVIEKGITGEVLWTTRDSVTVRFLGIPMGVTMRQEGLRKLD